jgi:hypothetical protein
VRAPICASSSLARNDIEQEQDKGKYVGMVLLDLKKTFNTVHHGILIQKLKALGFDNSALN